MIIGIGHDTVDIRRIEKIMRRFPARFAMRCFTTAEREYAQTRRNSGGEYEIYAKRFAAKEACSKALGTGFRSGLKMVDIGIVHDDHHAPQLVLTGAAHARLDSITPAGRTTRLHLSLSDEPPYASAFVVIEAV